MNNFWMGMAAAQSVATATKPDRRHRILSVICGIGLALLIGAGVFIIAALNS